MATLPSGKMTSSHAARVVMQGFAGMEDNDDKVCGGGGAAIAQGRIFGHDGKC